MRSVSAAHRTASTASNRVKGQPKSNPLGPGNEGGNLQPASSPSTMLSLLDLAETMMIGSEMRECFSRIR